MRYVIFGYGNIARELVKLLDGEFLIISRKPKINNMKIYNWNVDLSVLENSNVFINLCGESILGIWNKSKKKKIVDSRIKTTLKVVEIISKLKNKPKFFFNASAVGYYGNRGDEILTENSKPGNGFLAELAVQWENTALMASNMVNCVIMRFGVVIGNNLFMKLQKLLYNFHLGFYIGNGNRWQSYIHIKDIAGIIEFIISKGISGVFNFTSNPILEKDFVKTFSKITGKRQFLKIPEIFFEINEFTKTLKHSIRAIPKRLLDEGYRFKFYNVEDAIINTLNGSF